MGAWCVAYGSFENAIPQNILLLCTRYKKQERIRDLKAGLNPPSLRPPTTIKPKSLT